MIEEREMPENEPAFDLHPSSCIIHRSSCIPVLVIFYVAVVLALFMPFFWLCPLSGVSLLTILLAAICYLTAQRNPAHGVLVLSFLVPVVGSLPHLAPVRCPPPLLMMVGGFALGSLVRRYQSVRESENQTASKEIAGSSAVALLFLLFSVSGVLTAWRYLSNAPFGGWPTLQATVNLRKELASEVLGAVWQTLAVVLSGPLVFLLVGAAPRDERWLGRWVRVLMSGTLLACLVGLLQILFLPSLGNNPYWIKHNRINATFTDPNGLGAFVALVFPLMAAMAVGAHDRRTKILGAVVVLLSLLMLAQSGSRTGAAGVMVALVLFPALLAFRFKIEGDAFRRRVMFATLASIIVIAAFTPVEHRGESQRWILLNRLAKTREVIARQGLLAPVVRDRWPLWKPTIHVVLRYSIGGIGLGAFRYEMENIARLDQRPWRWLDNANNTYLQTAGELGLIGLAIMIVAFAALIRAMLRVIRAPNLVGEARVIYPALGTAWLGFVVLLMTAMWLLFEQIQVMVWLFAAVFAWHPSFPAGLDLRRRRWLIALGIASVGAVGAYQMLHNFGDLSLASRRALLGLEQSEGFHAWETDETGRRFRWTGEEARLVVPTNRGEIRINLVARNPDLATRPLGVWFSLDGKPAGRSEITSSNWQWVRVSVPPNAPDRAELRIRVERTWRPRDLGFGHDTRVLGVAVARIENADSSDPLPP